MTAAARRTDLGSSRSRLTKPDGPLAAAVAISLAGFAGAGVAFGGTAFVLVIVGVPIIALVALAKPRLLLYGSIIVALVLPASASAGIGPLTFSRLGPLLAIGYLIIQWSIGGHRKRRFSKVEWALITLLAVMSLSMLTSGVNLDKMVVLDAILPFSIFFAIRIATEIERKDLLWLLLGAGAVSAVLIVIEGFIGHRVFDNAATYGGTYWHNVWGGSDTKAFRPSGVFNSPPHASAITGCCLLVSAPLWWGVGQERVRLARTLAVLLLAASFMTFTRATLLATVVALGLVFAISRPRGSRAATVASAALVGIAALTVIIPGVSQTDAYQKAFGRPTSLASRQSFADLALPVVFSAGPATAVFGHGQGLIRQARLEPSTSLGSDLGTVPFVATYGVHNHFIYVLIETGILGVAALVAWMLTVVLAGWRHSQEGSSYGRIEGLGLIGAVLIYAVTMWFNEVNAMGSLVPLVMVSGLAASLQRGLGYSRHVNDTCET